jgi:hypothetical protein
MRAGWLLLLLFVLIGCDEAAAKPVSLTRRGLPAKVRSLEPMQEQGKGKGEGQGRGRKRGRKHDTPVYVDGKLIAALRFNELPATLPVNWHELDHSEQALRFAFTDYFTAMGVPVDKIRALHLYGGRRVMTISGDEVKRVGKGLHFQFSRGIGGQPAYKHAGAVDTNTSIDKISAVAVYVDSDPPEVINSHLKIASQGADQDVLERGGLRVYLDGRMVARLTRKELDGDDVALTELLAKAGVKLAGVKLGQAISKDAIAATLDPKQVAGLRVAAAPQSGGQLMLVGVAKDEAVEALILFARHKPVDRVAEATAGPTEPAGPTRK